MFHKKRENLVLLLDLNRKYENVLEKYTVRVGGAKYILCIH